MGMEPTLKKQREKTLLLALGFELLEQAVPKAMQSLSCLIQFELGVGFFVVKSTTLFSSPGNGGQGYPQ